MRSTYTQVNTVSGVRDLGCELRTIRIAIQSVAFNREQLKEKTF